MVLGTPRYMAPEQATGEAVDTRTDLFSAGAMIFEMLAGRPAFNGATAVAILHATLHEQPPALTGSAAVAAVDRVIRRAMSKRPGDRQASADDMAAELRAIGGAGADDTPAVAHALTRLVVLPFRVLRADPETDFLAFSLPDAISTSLSGRGSLIVRSSATAARFAKDIPDFKVLAAEADVDRVVTGSLLRSGDNLRVTVQLVEAPGGTLLASHSVQSSLGDLFRLQDDIAGKVTEALALPLGGTTTALPADVPQNARAYELYLRANEVGSRYYRLDDAAELYRQCLELDPNFAPAWAMLGRCYRLIGKFVREVPEANTLAEEAYRRALVINPRLSIAHKYYANLEADTGHGRRGLERLMGEATRRPNDPELFAGLVHACRYCGLFEESLGGARRGAPPRSPRADQRGTDPVVCRRDRPPRHQGPSRWSSVRRRRRRDPGRRARARGPTRRGIRAARTNQAAAHSCRRLQGLAGLPGSLAARPPGGNAGTDRGDWRAGHPRGSRSGLRTGMDVGTGRRSRNGPRLSSSEGSSAVAVRR